MISSAAPVGRASGLFAALCVGASCVAEADAIAPVPQPIPAPNRRVWVRAVGDVMVARGIQTQWQGEQGLNRLFGDAKPLLRAADISFANLEAVVALGGTQVKKEIALRAHPNAVLALVDAGFDVVSLANNHAEDFGLRGLRESRARLEEAGIAAAGAQWPGERRGSEAILTRHGLRTAFLAYTVFESSTLRINDDPVSLALVADEVREVRLEADFVVVSFHWGVEYERLPTARQRALGRIAIDAGADLVLGHHPHRVQGVEIYDGRPIVYSLGNFLFDQSRRVTRDSVIVDWRAGEDGSRALRLIPVRISVRPFTPRVLRGRRATVLLADYQALASELGTRTRVEDGAVHILGLGEQIDAGAVAARGGQSPK